MSARPGPAGGLSLASFFLVESLAAKGPSDVINVVALVDLKTRGSSPLLDTVLWGKDFPCSTPGLYAPQLQARPRSPCSSLLSALPRSPLVMLAEARPGVQP